ncbi:SAM-dependent methyltransferase [Streptomonospora wellingtoniae]|uniref:SAM-dependent methyltransferase n=1 Tax=Streptomonospora wellingtoniae TaxID=3075544 RepID=A0ABU2KRP2_9ACTN|nr:SAM-dependent methyltransferase [Streptomonospora sp. DSM 45055]MDT0301886.1 SAM-dependent methyltransferase [Streptomonospora sp. DSM 45055]
MHDSDPATTGAAPPFPTGIDLSRPSIARMYDAGIGGKDNFEIDREAVLALEALVPGSFAMARANRDYLSRAVDHVARSGVRQYIDLGSGLPTMENTHEIAQRHHPDAGVVYVDNDPIVLAHGRALLAEDPSTTVITSDLCDVDRVLGDAATRHIIDFTEPVCLMLVSLLHCVPDDRDPFGIVRAYVDRLAPGSCLVYTHIVSDDAEVARSFTAGMHSFGAYWGRVRTPDEASRVFEGMRLASPSLDGDFPAVAVDCSTWRVPGVEPQRRPADPEVPVWEHAGVAYI